MPVSPELITLLGAFVWGISALTIGLPRGHVPSEFPAIFSFLAFLGSLVGLTSFTVDPTTTNLLTVAAVLYTVAPLVIAAWIWHLYAEADTPPPDGEPKTLEDTVPEEGPGRPHSSTRDRSGQNGR